ncbi:hypothetical protein QJS10_CPA16g00555 [Acorus calamus]|uniref:RNase H type-1 domain-containing protein n=1 Tax=Acorus calamus TaxID=4465 RepID=A0AAV9D4W3_ACOCL|nr:hypothetical protein QJS10_CPA16g00555 [Acorus calamus]
MEEGGLGIKRILNWDIATKKESLWVKWIHSRYLKINSIWDAQPKPSSTTVWRKILAAREWVKPRVKFLIYDGENNNLCSDPWLEGEGLKVHLGDRFSLHFGQASQSKLSRLICQGEWLKPRRWPADLVQLWENISEIEIGGSGIDEIVWSPNSFGKLTLREAWQAVRNRGETPNWAEWVWQNSQVPKHSFTLWQVWQSILHKAAIRKPSIQALLSEIQWMNSTFKKEVPKKIMKAVFSTTVWHIWLERNGRIFKGKSQNFESIVTLILRDIKLKFSRAPLHSLMTPDLERMKDGLGIYVSEQIVHSQEICWVAPSPGWTKANTDGSKSEDRAGYGFLLRNHLGQLIIAEAACTDQRSINYLELQAIGQCLKSAKCLGIHNLGGE